MASVAADEDADAVLSDVEAEDPSPISFQTEDISADRIRQLIADLDRERQAREAAEAAKSDLQASFNRLKVLAHEAIKKRDEALREKEDLVRSSEKLSSELEDSLRLKDEALKQRDEIAWQLEEAVKAKDSSRAEIESTAQMLVTGIEKISGKASGFKNFSAGGLPMSQKYSGLPAIAYGVIKRTNEIVEELLKQVDAATKSRNGARDQMEQRNYEIAIEVSQLEAMINGLRVDLGKKAAEADNLEKSVAERDAKIAEMEREMSEMKCIGEEYNLKLRSLESKVDLQRPLIIDQLNYISKTHDRICEIIRTVVGADKLDQMGFSDSVFLSNEMDMDESLRASLTGMTSIYELAKVAVEKVTDGMEGKNCEVKGLNEMIARLVTEKKHIGSLLRSALSRKAASDPSSKASEVLQVAENGLRRAGIDVRFNELIGNGENLDVDDVADGLEAEEDEVYTLAGALEKIVQASQLEIIELQHSMEMLRAESNLLKAHVEAQAKELNQRKNQIKELEEKEQVANESVEGLMTDIAAAEEEIARWKLAAEQEAAAGRAVEQEFMAQLAALRQELEEAKQAMVDSENKLKFKEETAAAAMAARDAAEKSLRLADLRASRLRERVEELTRQVEESDNRDDLGNQSRQRYVCWPWEWLGLNFVGNPAQVNQGSNEMELSEPLL
ncbi:uncharacterized protein LOC131239835 [Magnolia sinica]|uniref:uncharacterized protein LOC131239835 n=1 Tax=Magnolia sinica TaxID=86752 RepID=UPI00265AA299|nr:uncharacterized protein LOC131239835 [Magnolia sinica]